VRTYQPDGFPSYLLWVLASSCHRSILSKVGASSLPGEVQSDDYLEASNLLKKMKLRSTDFEKIVDAAIDGDFVFIDPPYTVKHNLNGFVRYNERMFSWKDQVRLAASVRRAVARGCKVAVTNADHESVRALYDFADYRPLSRTSLIAGSAVKRVTTTEALFIANY
jgi:DNA adenine methylase